MKSPRISVIVPVYNLENELPKCIESICAQTHKNLELILVDDGSNDNSWKVICDFAQLDKRIVSLRQANAGVTSARLAGISAATGDFLGFVDGDDVIEEDMYEKLLCNAQAFHADISHCGHQMIFPDSRTRYYHNTGKIVHQSGADAAKALLLGDYEPGLCNKLYRRCLVQKVLQANTIDPEIKNNEDLLMNFFLFEEAESTTYEDFCPYHYMVRSSSASRTKLNDHKIFDPIRVKKIIMDHCRNELLPTAQEAFLMTCTHAYCRLTGKKGYTDEKNRIRDYLRESNICTCTFPLKLILLTRMVKDTPQILEVLYPIYRKKFQKKKYW